MVDAEPILARIVVDLGTQVDKGTSRTTASRLIEEGIFVRENFDWCDAVI
jgi:hypothetical protein